MIVAERPTEQETPRQEPPLRMGDALRCPHCRRVEPEDVYVRIGRAPDFVAQTVPVYLCRRCGKHFALRPDSTP